MIFAVFIGLLLCSGTCFGQLYIYDATTDGSFGQEDIVDAQKDNSGNWIFGGTFCCTSVFAAWGGNYIADVDGFIIKHYPNGTRMWVVTFGGNSVDEVGGIAVDKANDDVFAVGRTNSTIVYWDASQTTNGTGSADFYIVRYDSAGTFQWANLYGGSGDDFAYDAIVAGTNIIVTGYSTSAWGTITNNGASDIFVISFTTSDGTMGSAVSFGGSDADESRSIWADATGFYIVGFYKSSSMSIGAFSLSPPSAGNQNIVIFKLNIPLVPLWATSGSCSAGDGVANAVVTEASGETVVGYCTGDLTVNSNVVSAGSALQNGFLLKLDSLGTFAWAKMFNNSNINGVTNGQSGTIYITGNYAGSSFNMGGTNLPNSGTSTDAMFVAKYEGNGVYDWSIGYTSTDILIGRSIAVNTAGTAAIGAQFMGTTTIQTSNFTFTSVSNSDDAMVLFWNDITLPSPSVTPSISVSPSRTPSPSATASRTASASVSHSASPLIPASPSPSISASASPSISSSPSASISPTCSSSPSVSVSPSQSVTPSASPTPSVDSQYTQITLELEGSLSDFNSTEFLNDMAAILNIPVDTMKIVQPSTKSYTVIFNIYDVLIDSTYAAQTLVALVDEDSATLTDRGLNVLDIQVDYSHSANPPNSPASDNSNTTIIVIIAVVASVVGVGAGAVIVAMIVKRRKPRQDKDVELMPRDSETPPPIETPVKAKEPEKGHSQKKKNSWEIDFPSITMEKELGRGAFGVVWRKVVCVVKQLDESQGGSAESFMKEANNVKDIRPHPNICAILGVCLDPTYPICIVMEYVPYGSLWDMIINNKIKMNQDLLLDFAMDIASGMSHLHFENVIHCDLACRNLLVAPKQGNDKYTIKITDFGLSRVTEQDLYNANKNAMFPVRWTAPETIRGRIVSRASDVWSFAVTLWEMSEGKQPYPDLSNLQVTAAVCDRGERLAKPATFSFPDEVYDLMILCWNENPKERPSFDSICQELTSIHKKIRGGTTFGIYHNPGNTSHINSYGNSTATSLDAPTHVSSYGSDSPVPQSQSTSVDGHTASSSTHNATHNSTYGNEPSQSTSHDSVYGNGKSVC